MLQEATLCKGIFPASRGARSTHPNHRLFLRKRAVWKHRISSILDGLHQGPRRAWPLRFGTRSTKRDDRRIGRGAMLAVREHQPTRFDPMDRAGALGAFAGLLTVALCAGLASSKPEQTECGSPGKPPCPLQRWMREQVAAPLSAKDYRALEQSFERIAQLNPDPAGWANWTKIAKEGATAARQRKLAGVRSTCGRCHRAYRRAYNARHRTLAIDSD
jgi:hypothetical protein